MKFRAEMTEILCMKQFANIIETLSKFTKLCVIRICEDKIYFIVLDDSCIGDHPLIWCVLEQANFFRRHCVVGLNENNNEIFLEFEPDMMAKSLNFLKSSQVAESLTIKLTNKQSPCLTFEVNLTSTTLGRMCVHDIPVTVVPHKQWRLFVQPEMPRFNVKIELPNLKLLRSVVERMKTLNTRVTIIASDNGELVFKVETMMADMATHFKNLSVLDKEAKEECDRERIQSASPRSCALHPNSRGTWNLENITDIYWRRLG
ncbi:checkpoint protein HUS1 isoform X2 [Bacillus rossius redtenbacheri]|uniref:checkpoint protein HUS1 isoform X2 n=1 Tax=Bacillus rossius redtenbacheri TaxID=93214 RepID=UPI002FDCA02A